MATYSSVAPSPMLSSSRGPSATTAIQQPSVQSTSCSQQICTISRSLQTSLIRSLRKQFARNWSTCGSHHAALLCQFPSSRHTGCSSSSSYAWSSAAAQGAILEQSCGAIPLQSCGFCYSNKFFRRLQIGQRRGDGKRHAGKIQAYMRLDPGGGGGGRGPNGNNNGIGRVVFNLALAGGLTYLTVTGKLGWLFDAFISLWLLVILVPIVSIVAFLWFADREIVSGSCPNCGNAFQVLEFTVKDEQQFCPYCSQPFKLEGKEFVRDGPRFSARQSAGFQSPFGGFGQRTSTAPEASAESPGVIVDVEAEVVDKD